MYLVMTLQVSLRTEGPNLTWRYEQCGPAFDCYRSARAWARNYNANAAPLIIEVPSGPGVVGRCQWTHDADHDSAVRALGTPAVYP